YDTELLEDRKLCADMIHKLNHLLPSQEEKGKDFSQTAWKIYETICDLPVTLAESGDFQGVIKLTTNEMADWGTIGKVILR
ncbi:MAG: hypothetical protein K2I47_04765, partial [Odoribacter sp.]|nr:hypothetical protein [Odoribacter sp.]